MKQRIKELLTDGVRSASKLTLGMFMLIVAFALVSQSAKFVAELYGETYTFDFSAAEKKWIALLLVIWMADLIIRPIVKRAFNIAFSEFREAFEILERMGKNNEKENERERMREYNEYNRKKWLKEHASGEDVVHERDAAIKSQ